MLLRRGLLVRASRTASFRASAERFVDDGLDGARAAAAFGAATEATIDLLGAARKIFAGAHGIADIVIGQDVTGTNNHEKDGAPAGDAWPSDIEGGPAKQKENPRFQAIPNWPRRRWLEMLGRPIVHRKRAFGRPICRANAAAAFIDHSSEVWNFGPDRLLIRCLAP
jgi:hypothetical protein